MSEKRREILERLHRGDINAEEAEELLQGLEGDRGLLRSLCHGLGDLADNYRHILEEEHTGTLESGPVELDLKAINGSISVKTWDSPGYRLLITKRVKAASLEEAETLCRNHQFAQIHGNKIQAGDPLDSTAQQRISVSLSLQLPRQSTATGLVRTANGSIRISGLGAGQLNLTSNNGSIQLEDVSGGPIAAKTVNGSIKTSGETGQIEAATTNGSINLTSPHLGGDIRLTTVNGSVKVAFPSIPDTAFAITASTTCGRVKINHSEIGINKGGGHGCKHIETRSANWDQAQTKVNLDLSTVNGSISLQEI